MRTSQGVDLTTGSITRHLLRLSGPMTMGMIGMIIFNLVDAYYIGKLGTDPLAAIAFTFPVVLIVNSLAGGIGLGSSVLFSKMLGKSDHKSGEELVLSSALLGLVTNIFLMVLGMLTIKPVFSSLGAEGPVLELVGQYMSVWYSGLIALVIPQIGNNLIRATGNTKTPSIIVAVAGLSNAILDPIFIFGYGPVPALGIRGAAIATVLSRSITLIATAYILVYKERLFKWIRLPIKKILAYWKQILYLGVPNAAIQIAIPVGLGIITKIISSYGVATVAGFGIASKIEIFALAYINATAIILGPFAGQNIGKGEFSRIKTAHRLSSRISLIYGGFAAVILLIWGGSFSQVFSKDPSTIHAAAGYLRLVPFSYGFYGIMKISATVLNVLNKPLKSAAVIAFQIFGTCIPLALVASKFFGIYGVYTSLAISYMAAALIGNYILKAELLRLEQPDFKKNVV